MTDPIEACRLRGEIAYEVGRMVFGASEQADVASICGRPDLVRRAEARREAALVWWGVVSSERTPPPLGVLLDEEYRRHRAAFARAWSIVL